MAESDNQVLHQVDPKWKSYTISCFVSLISVFFTQLTLFLLPLFLPTSSVATLLPLSGFLFAIVIGLGRCCKRVAGVRASAPAFVFFSIFFIWAVYISVVRRVVSSLEDVLFNAEIVMVIFGLYHIMRSDPGFVTSDSSCCSPFVSSHPPEIKTLGEGLTVHNRVRYCRHCKAYILGFDHHCPAFGNCIGQKNHLFFIVLLVGILVSEVSYVIFALQFDSIFQTSTGVGIQHGDISRCLVLSTMIFSLIQVLWQVFFLMWHVHCACLNIKTDEWINWKKYPEFHHKTVTHAGERQTAPLFNNPYNKGLLGNLKEFLTGKG